jgi:hypothetical protein
MEISSQLTANAQAFAFAAAACLSTAKALQILERRRAARRAVEPRGLRKLFPTEQEDEIIRQIDDLREEVRERRKDQLELRAALQKIHDKLGI